MTLFLTILAGVAFFALIMASVALHEVGHLLPAKLFGVRVPKYFVGFGRTLWSRQLGETEVGVKLFPLGGFVQLLGMYPPARAGARDTRLQRLADEARAVEWEDIKPSDQGRLFYEQPTWQKLIMMAGGITMNLILAFGLFWGVGATYGTVRPQPVVYSVVACVNPSGANQQCASTDRPTPAASAGLKPGDKIVEFNGVPIATHGDLTALIRANRDAEARLVVERDGVRTPLASVHTMVASVADPWDPSKRVQAGYLGFSAVQELTKTGPVEVLSDMRDLTVQSVVSLVQLPVKTFNVALRMIEGKPREITDPISVVGASAAAGQVATAEQVDPAARAAMLVNLLAALNLFLAIFNLVPLPPLDGGHIVGALYEGARRLLARVTGRPDPGPADTAKLLPVAYVVGGSLLLMGIVLIVADIVSPIRIF